ncbi:trehalase-like [Stylophora pistillata]|uniref:trehalase-like n=1 Tax=Stylophora pistillata TaxID=50429 RepID=UPI000C048EDF|nr:trehalase-like [Stylophora pistillata]
MEVCSFLLQLCFLAFIFKGITAEKPACNSEIFCRGDLLHTVQMARIFNDSKTFVDMRLRRDKADVLQAFKALGPSGNISKEQVIRFVNDNFHPIGHDLQAWTPLDWQENPAFIDCIKDKNLKTFASKLNELWKKLGRKISEDARTNPTRSSLILVTNPFVVPGGRFREYYYWDSYWVVNGLLVCGMKDTVKGMIDNFIQLVNTYGFVPNGGRIYYTNRSQPPFLIPTVGLYLNKTGDVDYVKSILNALEKEYIFWRRHRTVEVEVSSGKYNLSIYAANMDTPRPESYYEDFHTAQEVPEDARSTLFQDIASAAESGWDFSTRWFNHTDRKRGSLRSTQTRQIIPTDLNSILFACENLLEKFFRMTGNTAKADEYKIFSEVRAAAIEAVLWDEKGLWLDYDRQLKKRRGDFYASSVVPLWAGVLRGNVARETMVLRTLKRLKVLDYPGGLPTSLLSSGQQWDFPNAWPPLQHMLITGLAESRGEGMKEEALNFAQKWITANYKAWRATGHMFEKFNVSVQGTPGGGGEYDIQVGFGWTNGVILDLLQRYPDKLVSGQEHTSQVINPPPKARGNLVVATSTSLICNIILIVFGI